MVFPTDSWSRIDPVAAGLDPARLDGLQAYLADQKSDCMAVVKDGQVVQDTYWNGSDATTPHEVFSVTKSITSMLVGIAQAEGDLDIDEPASKYITEWQGTPSESVTIRDLLANAFGSVLESEQRLQRADPRAGQDGVRDRPSAAGSARDDVELQQQRHPDARRRHQTGDRHRHGRVRAHPAVRTDRYERGDES